MLLRFRRRQPQSPPMPWLPRFGSKRASHISSTASTPLSNAWLRLTNKAQQLALTNPHALHELTVALENVLDGLNHAPPSRSDETG